MTPNDKKLIASLYASPMFEALRKYIAERIDVVRSKPSKKENEFETTYALGESEGRQKELQELIRAIEEPYKRFKEEK